MSHAESGTAQVVAAHGQRGRLETADGEVLPYLIKGRRLRIVCGDRVDFSAQGAGEPVLITACQERSNSLQRNDPSGTRPEILAANITAVMVTLAPVPETDWFMVDRYLCAAELMRARSALIWNKADLAPPGDALETYRRIGYPVLETCVPRRLGLEAVMDFLAGQTGILVGSSGVGKSSLINVLVPSVAAAVGAISEATAEGRHTTTASVMYSLPNGGRLVDTPGVRDFVPLIDLERSVQNGFREIVAAADDCRFADCRHLREPGCAVKDKVASGAIDARRYESYRRLLRTVPDRPGR